VKHAPSGRDVVMPGAPFNLAGTPWRIARPAPALGEHNAEIFTSIGILPQDVVFLAAAGVV
jgi:crotonobetainyl-CoA:carnitine CoA-transferase CaiB-like acyl-CoA transferase